MKREPTYIDGVEITPEVAERTWGPDRAALPNTPGWNAWREDMERSCNEAMDTWRADRQAEKDHADAVAYDQASQQKQQQGARSRSQEECMAQIPTGGFWPPGMSVEDRKLGEELVGRQRAFATNHDAGKLRLDLIPPEWIIALGEVMTAGAPEYGDRNWEKGMKWSRHLGSLLRHLVKWMGGEVHDPKTGLHHLKHVAWRALALVSYAEWGVGENDLSMRWTR